MVLSCVQKRVGFFCSIFVRVLFATIVGSFQISIIETKPYNRCLLYSNSFPSLGIKKDGSNVVCVSGFAVDSTSERRWFTEAIVLLTGTNLDKVDRVLQENDVFSWSACNLCEFPEFRFENDDTWRVCRGDAQSLISYREFKFGEYEKEIKTIPPPCMAGLARMLHQGPVTKLYENQPVGRQIFPMSQEELVAFQHTRPDGKVVILPRPLAALRVFSPETGQYKELDLTLDGAPQDEEKWWDDLVCFLKSNLHGPARDEHMLAFYEKDLLENDQFTHQVQQMGENKWIHRVREVKGVVVEKKE